MCYNVQVKEFFAKQKVPIDAKYIDPTYMIRARACNSGDHIFCSILGQNAVKNKQIFTSLLTQSYTKFIYQIIVHSTNNSTCRGPSSYILIICYYHRSQDIDVNLGNFILLT